MNCVFVPHLLPLSRGILETIYVKKAAGAKSAGQDLVSLYKKFYKTEPFVRVKDRGEFPRLKDVVGTNFCDISLQYNETTGKIIVLSTIDNVFKGAAGQAVQNMNLMFGVEEKAGLNLKAVVF